MVCWACVRASHRRRSDAVPHFIRARHCVAQDVGAALLHHRFAVRTTRSVATTGPKTGLPKCHCSSFCRVDAAHPVDACALYPTVMREMVIGCCAGSGVFEPLWSARPVGKNGRRAAISRLGPRGRSHRPRRRSPCCAPHGQRRGPPPRPPCGRTACICRTEKNDVHVWPPRSPACRPLS